MRMKRSAWIARMASMTGIHEAYAIRRTDRRTVYTLHKHAYCTIHTVVYTVPVHAVLWCEYRMYCTQYVRVITWPEGEIFARGLILRPERSEGVISAPRANISPEWPR